MSLNGVNNVNTVTENYVTNTTAKDKVESNNKDNKEVQEQKTASNESGAVYEKTKLSADDRKAIVNQLKADMEKRHEQLKSLVQDMISKQTNTFVIASDDDIWKFLAKGKFEVDEETKKKAQEDISEDGYWGVKQTSDRIIDFAKALAGNDTKALEKMKDAFLKGYKQAEKTWGGKLPEISQKTYDAVLEKFDKLINPKTEEVETVEE